MALKSLHYNYIHETWHSIGVASDQLCHRFDNLTGCFWLASEPTAGEDEVFTRLLEWFAPAVHWQRDWEAGRMHLDLERIRRVRAGAAWTYI